MAIRKRTEYKDKHGRDVWYYDFWHNDQRHRKTGFATKCEAEIAESRAKKIVYSGKAVLRPSTFAELVDPFFEYRQGRVAANTISRDERRIPTMMKFFGAQRLSIISSAEIEKYVGQRGKAGMSPRTINLEINLLSSIFQFAISQGFAYENPVKGVRRLKTSQVELNIPSAVEFRALIDGAMKTEVGLELATWIIFRGYSGTRPAESFYVEWRDINFDTDQIAIRPKKGNPLKNGKARYVPLHPELKTALLTWKKEWDSRTDGRKPHDWIFFHPRFPERQCHRFERSYLKAQTFAGLPEHMTSHCLRHFFISMAVMADINFLTIAKWVGHSSTRMIEQVYAHLSPKFKNGEMQKLQLGLMNGHVIGKTEENENQLSQEKKVDSKVA